MADRLSQLQDAVNQQAENLYNSIGCLFNSAAPCTFDKSGKTPSQTENLDDMTEHKRVFATVIARNAKDIDALIESLPSEDSSAELQPVDPPKRSCYWNYASARWDDLRMYYSDFPWNDYCFRDREASACAHRVTETASMRILEQEGEEAAQRLQRGIDRGDKLLEEINRALTEIANTQLAINRITEASQGDAIKI